MNKLKEKLKKVPWHIWILAAVILLGTFLRTYQFHAWLDFGSDQVNDATRVTSVVRGESSWPLLGPDMSNSGSGSRESRYRLGPMYYYFQIISAKIFGTEPYKLAYPDLLFSVLSLPLFYVFLRRYFGKNITLALTGLFAISFYALKFSHSAWNPNSIPFFTLLFLLALLEFIEHRKEASWLWVVLLGISLGVGVQLHAITMVLFFTTAFFVFLYLLQKDFGIWKKSAIVFLIVLGLNFGHLTSEYVTDFTNSKTFLLSLLGGEEEGKKNKWLKNFEEDLDCHIEANAYILSSLGPEDADYSYIKVLEKSKAKNFLEKKREFFFWPSLIIGLLLSVLGYGAIAYKFRREKDLQRKHFLGLVGVFSALSFGVLLPIIDPQLRYFVHMIFLPFVFLGFLSEYLSQKFPQKHLWLNISIFALIVLANVSSTQTVVKELVSKTRSGSEVLVLGELESIADYVASESAPQKEVYFLSGNRTSNFFKPLGYVLGQRGIVLSRAPELSGVELGRPAFYVGELSKDEQRKKGFGMPKNFGQVNLYKLASELK